MIRLQLSFVGGTASSEAFFEGRSLGEGLGEGGLKKSESEPPVPNGTFGREREQAFSFLFPRSQSSPAPGGQFDIS
jgi:hypothetical protein